MSEKISEKFSRGELLNVNCPSREVLKRVTSRWSVLIFLALRNDTLRFSELRRAVGGVSERMLAQTLRHMEEDGFVERIAYNVVPPHVEYRLTPLGREIGFAALPPALLGAIAGLTLAYLAVAEGLKRIAIKH